MLRVSCGEKGDWCFRWYLFVELPRDTTRCVGASKSPRAYRRTRLGIQLDVQLGARVGAQVEGEQRGAHTDGPRLEVHHGARMTQRTTVT